MTPARILSHWQCIAIAGLAALGFATAASGTPPSGETSASQRSLPPIADEAIPVPRWTLADAQALLAFIHAIGNEGLIPADYAPQDLSGAIVAGEGSALDEVADRSFAWLAEDLRDGRTPVNQRTQWYATDTDADNNPTAAILARALRTRDIAGTLSALNPAHSDYTALKQALARTPASDKALQELIQVNMDRWRWYSRDLGDYYLIVNVPEFRLRLMKDDRVVRSYRTIVGKPGQLATPHLAERVEAVVFNPIWTVPRVIVNEEGLGERLIADPAYAEARGFELSRRSDGSLRVIQKPGPTNVLGKVKIDMPNRYGIYIHDTPGRALFDRDVPALSHGCVRAEDALELGMTLAAEKSGKTLSELNEIANSGELTKVALDSAVPVYTSYFTMAVDENGKLSVFPDVYGRDARIAASFEGPVSREGAQQVRLAAWSAASGRE